MPKEKVAPSLKTIDYQKANKNDFRNKSPFRAGVQQYPLSKINYTSTKKNTFSDTLGRSRLRPEDFLIVREFQPDLRFNWVEEAAKLADLGTGGFETGVSSFVGAIAGRGLNRVNGKSAADNAKTIDDNAAIAKKGVETTARIAIKKGQETQINEIVAELAGSGGSSAFLSQVIVQPVEQVRSMLSGKEVAYFEIPYNGEVFLTNQQSSFWKGAADLKSALEGANSSTMQILKDSTAINFPATPTWASEEGGGAPEPISIDLVLYNNNLENLINNYSYVHGLMQGVYWSQIGYFQKSSNLYDITLPGRLRYFFCTLEAQVQFVGKRRRLPNTMTGKFNDKFKGGAKALNPEIANNGWFPDAYRLSLTFKSLMPNNYNMYLQYFLNGSQLATVGAIGAKEFNTGIVEAGKRLGDATLQIGKTLKDEAIKTLKGGD